jgi:hypothetical protein
MVQISLIFYFSSPKSFDPASCAPAPEIAIRKLVADSDPRILSAGYPNTKQKRQGSVGENAPTPPDDLNLPPSG